MRYLLHDVFEEGRRENRGAPAVIHESGECYSYEDLHARANQYAAYLKQAATIQENPFVGIMGPINFESIAFVLGILRVGGVYVPLDDQSPPDRVDQIIDNTGLKTIGVFGKQMEKFCELYATRSDVQLVVLDVDPCVAVGVGDSIQQEDIDRLSTCDHPLLHQVSDDLAYVLHTSGSTGVPKGIMLSHRNARTFVDWMHKEFEVCEQDVIASRAPFKFDLSVFDIFNTLKAGASLVCFDWNARRESGSRHEAYVALLAREQVSMLYTTPSTFITLMNKGGLNRLQGSLRTCMYAGEPFPVPQLRKVMQCLPKTRFSNIYGPTETNIITYYWIDALPEDTEAVPLGAVVDDTEILVVAEEGNRICDPDEVGELWCRGGTVTSGYLGMPEKSAACLVQSPFHPYPAWFWRTGDFGRRDAEDVLHYHGRRDHMVKVLGFRIELGEVESALAAIEALHQSVVVAVPDEQYGNRLHCFYAAMPGVTITDDEVSQELARRIPEYMMPYAFHSRDVLPETSSGKIDRVRLQEEAQSVDGKS